METIWRTVLIVTVADGLITSRVGECFQEQASRNDKGRIVDLYGTETEVLLDTVGQFTGLRGINGKDIYEGDILAAPYAGYLEVRFVRGVFAFLWKGDLDDEFPCNAPTHEWAKVIGNIYDNPKLIKRH